MAEREQSIRVMIAGGGTGGHVYPGVAIYRALASRGAKVEALFVGARAGVEERIFAELGLPSVLLSGHGVRGKSLLLKVTSPVSFAVGIARGIAEIAAFKPDVVIGTGGYASVAIVAASVLCRRPRAIQEQNSVPGMANRLLSRVAHLVLLSYPESRPFFGRRARCEVVGNPLRIPRRKDREAGLAFFGLRGDLPTVLVLGGSRGARAINRAAASAIKRILAAREVQFLLLSGESDHAAVSADLRGHERHVRVLPFLQEMEHAYSVADVAVSRAGASAVFELAAFGVPSVFVPYPHAADDHQSKNVEPLRRRDAAVVIADGSLGAEGLEAIILALLDDHGRRAEMSRRIREWAVPDADERAAEKILDLIGARRLTMRTAAGAARQRGNTAMAVQ